MKNRDSSGKIANFSNLCKNCRKKEYNGNFFSHKKIGLTLLRNRCQ